MRNHIKMFVLLFLMVSVMMSLSACGGDSQTAAPTAPEATPVGTAPSAVPTAVPTDVPTTEEDTSSEYPLRINEIDWTSYDVVQKVISDYSDHIEDNFFFMDGEDVSVTIELGSVMRVTLSANGENSNLFFNDSSLVRYETVMDQSASDFDWMSYDTVSVFFDTYLTDMSTLNEEEFSLFVRLKDKKVTFWKRGTQPEHVAVELDANQSKVERYTFTDGVLDEIDEPETQPVTIPYEEPHHFIDVDWHSYEAVMATYNGDQVVAGNVPSEKIYRCGEGEVSIIVEGSKTTVHLGGVQWYQDLIYENGVLRFYADSDGTVINY